MTDECWDLVFDLLHVRWCYGRVLSLLPLAGYKDRLLIMSVMLSCGALSHGKEGPHTTDIVSAVADRTIRVDGDEDYSPGNLHG